MRDGFKNQKRNPEVPVDVLRSSSLLNEQVFALKALTNLLKNAHQGLDVEWDMEEVFHGGESSGMGAIASSGDGSGDEDSEESPSAPVDGLGTSATASTTSTSTTTTTTSAASATTDSAATTPSTVKTKHGHGDNNESSSSGHKAKPTIQKALATYLLPVVAVWFGGSFLEWIL